VQGLCLIVEFGLPDNNARCSGGSLLLGSLGDARASRRGGLRNSHLVVVVVILSCLTLVRYELLSRVKGEKKKRKAEARARKENIYAARNERRLNKGVSVYNSGCGSGGS
jgi:hypothetical protein